MPKMSREPVCLPERRHESFDEFCDFYEQYVDSYFYEFRWSC